MSLINTSIIYGVKYSLTSTPCQTYGYGLQVADTVLYLESYTLPDQRPSDTYAMSCNL